MTDDKKPEYKSHPAYGSVVFHRVTGGVGRLYGSHLRDHTTSVRLSISRAQVKHDLSQDWHFASPADEIVEVELSYAQFAQLLTNMNVGNGTPCTIRHLNGKRIEPLPDDEKIEHEKIVDEFKEKINRLVDALKAGQLRVRELLSKKSALTKVEKEEIDHVLSVVVMEVGANAPFVVDQFQESAQKIVTEAKAEIDATITTAALKLGVECLQDKLMETVTALVEVDTMQELTAIGDVPK